MKFLLLPEFWILQLAKIFWPKNHPAGLGLNALRSISAFVWRLAFGVYTYLSIFQFLSLSPTLSISPSNSHHRSHPTNLSFKVSPSLSISLSNSRHLFQSLLQTIPIDPTLSISPSKYHHLFLSLLQTLTISILHYIPFSFFSHFLSVPRFSSL